MEDSKQNLSSIKFTVPQVGSLRMPRWEVGELMDPPRFTWRNWFALLGPGLLMGGAAIGGGEWLMGPTVTARYGGALMWLATLSIGFQVIYNVEISRYTLYTGEPIFTGFFRTLPGPYFWVFIFLLLDLGPLFPYLAANAATPVAAIWLGQIPDSENPEHTFLIKGISIAIFLICFIPLIFGGRIYHALKVVMSVKIVVVLGFLLVLGIFYTSPSTWGEVFSGFVKFGNVPIKAAEDTNGNGVLDPGEHDWDGDGHADVIEPDRTMNGDDSSDAQGFTDLDGDGTQDGDAIDNVFLAIIQGRGLPKVDLSMIGFLAAFAAIAGTGGLNNCSISNYTRDHGWGMGHHVGAIPSVVGGRTLKLSHVGMVFEISEEALGRWKRWYQHVCRDQLAVWMPACLLGIALPSMLSVQFLKRGTVANEWTTAGMTANGVHDAVSASSGATIGGLFWLMTLLCGFLVLAPSTASTIDGWVRRWVDIVWTASPRLRQWDPSNIRYLYFGVLCGYGVLGLFLLSIGKPLQLVRFATNVMNFALGFSCWHVIFVNRLLLPRDIRPGWFVTGGLFLAGLFFWILAVLSLLQNLGWIE